MVKSKIDNEKIINYPELKTLDPEDVKRESDLYEIEVELGKESIKIIIAVGNEKKTFSDKNISYFPIYLVKNDNTVLQIGVYEIPASERKKFLDKESNLEVEKMDDPLLYSFVTKDLLEELRLKPEEEKEKEKEEKEEEKEEIPRHRKDIFTLTEGIPIPKKLKEETKEDSKKEREKYAKKDDTWVEAFMENPNYYIVDNEGGGECLFATIRDAFSQIAQQTTIPKLRKRLSEEATEKLFMNYKKQYEDAKASVQTDTENIKQLEIQYEKYRKFFSETLDRNQKKQAIDAAKKLTHQIEQITKEKNISRQVGEEYKYMKDIETLEDFKKIITECKFLGEKWAISTLERILKIKFILLSNEAWKQNDKNNVVVCSHDSLEEEKEDDGFNPDYYLILEFNANNYKLVGYKTKQIFKFQEIPYDIKKKIAEKCMEKNAGLFSLIPDFIKFRKEIFSDSEPKKFDELSESKIRGLYDDDVVLLFYKSSADKIPGKGPGEKMEKDLAREFGQLASIKNWRKKLDNSWISQFVLDGHQWNSVEHYYQASKFKGSPEFYLSFAAESGTKLSKDPELAKAAASTSGKSKGELIRPKEISMDSDLNGKRKEQALKEAIEAKFTQNEELKLLLKETKKAKLMHYRKSKEPELAETLIFVRDKLVKSAD
jgi:predicted NAD-dependent protein-ADP-ribosyltransferase YbiA (DUF1768 family)